MIPIENHNLDKFPSTKVFLVVDKTQVEVFLFLTTTVAFGSTAPLESETVPWTVAVDWPNAEEVARRAATSIKNGKNSAVLLLAINTS